MIKINSFSKYGRANPFYHLYLVVVMIILIVIQGFLLRFYINDLAFFGILLSVAIILACIIVMISEIRAYRKIRNRQKRNR